METETKYCIEISLELQAAIELATRSVYRNRTAAVMVLNRLLEDFRLSGFRIVEIPVEVQNANDNRP